VILIFSTLEVSPRGAGTTPGSKMHSAANTAGVGFVPNHHGQGYVSAPGGYSLRGTIENLESKVQDIITEISYHRQQLIIVKSESETANQVLNMKIDEMRGRLEFEEKKIHNNMN